MRKSIILALCLVLMVFNKGDTEICGFKQVKYGNGFGVLFENGRMITAYHLVNTDDGLVFFDEEKDIAVVEVYKSDKKFSKFLVVKSDTESFIFSEWLIQRGDSGKAYVLNGKLIGIIVGRRNDKAVVSTVSQEVLSSLMN